MLPSESPFTPEDAAWLLMHQHRKVLDARVRITGVAARDAADGHPTVLVCYPLRDVGAESAAARSFEGRRETRGGSLRKWLSASPVPWPNFYWLCCPALAARVVAAAFILERVDRAMENEGVEPIFELPPNHHHHWDLARMSRRWDALMALCPLPADGVYSAPPTSGQV